MVCLIVIVVDDDITRRCHKILNVIRYGVCVQLSEVRHAAVDISIGDPHIKITIIKK